MHAYTHPFIHTYMHTYIYSKSKHFFALALHNFVHCFQFCFTNIHTYTHTYIYIYIHIYIYTYIHTYKQNMNIKREFLIEDVHRLCIEMVMKSFVSEVSRINNKFDIQLMRGLQDCLTKMVVIEPTALKGALQVNI